MNVMEILEDPLWFKRHSLNHGQLEDLQVMTYRLAKKGFVPKEITEARAGISIKFEEANSPDKASLFSYNNKFSLTFIRKNKNWPDDERHTQINDIDNILKAIKELPPKYAYMWSYDRQIINQWLKNRQSLYGATIPWATIC